jgi:dolichyl-diphosphooligosaccharide--protein glycosyltransferase
MSTWRERLQEESGPEVAWDWLVANYHYPSLALLLVFALYTRVASWGNFRTQGTILYSGNDPFYHLRSVQYAVEHFPATMPFDPWTNFALGTSNSQFGTIFDQLIAAAALIVGLGNPDDQLVRLVTLFAPAVFGTLTLVPAYLIGRRLGGRFGGVMSAAVVAFATGRLFASGFVGTSDHHIAEGLFQALGVLGMMVAVSVAQREKPVWELLADRSFGAMRQTLGWSLLGGTAVGVYLLVWPPGVLLLGILGVFFVLYLSTVFLRGRSPEHVAIAGAVAMVATAVITLSTVNSLSIEATGRSLLQPGLALAVAAGCGFMAWLARVWDERDITRLAYPATVVGIGVVIVGVVALVLPSIYGFFLNNVLRVIGLGLDRSQTAATVGEIASLPIGRLTEFYKLAIVVAVAGFVVVLVRQVVDDEPSAEQALAAVWFVFVVAATLTQQRFAYYLTIPVAGLVALFVGSVVDYVNATSDGDSIETHQIMTVGAVLLVVLVPMVAFAPTAMGSASAKGPGGGIQGWQPSLDYLESETPEPGTYANPGGEPMEYLGTFARTDDYDYPAGAYGILSWWDYGHWITTNGERIPVANPFQQGANVAASFLLSQNETGAAAALAEREEPDAKTELVMVDWKMAETETAVGGKYFAPPEFVDDVERSDFSSRVVDRQTLQETGNIVQSTLMVRQKQPYYESMITRLYHYHGSAAEPGPYVVEWQGQERPLRSGGTFTFAADNSDGPSPAIRRFRTVDAAREYVAEAPQVRQVGGIGTIPSERVPALEHYRLVHASPISALQSGAYQQARTRTVQRTNLQQVLGANVTRGQALNWLLDTTPSWTKTFERVPGATISGTGPENQTIRASVELQPNAGTNFTYTQQTRTDEDGSFSLTVPYATTGDDEWGVAEGYANSSVTALGSYNVTTATTVSNGTASRWAGQVDVTEGQVLGEDDSPAEVTLERESSELSISSGAEQDG